MYNQGGMLRLSCRMLVLRWYIWLTGKTTTVTARKHLQQGVICPFLMVSLMNQKSRTGATKGIYRTRSCYGRRQKKKRLSDCISHMSYSQHCHMSHITRVMQRRIPLENTVNSTYSRSDTKLPVRVFSEVTPVTVRSARIKDIRVNPYIPTSVDERLAHTR